MEFSRVILCLCEVMLLAIVVSSAPHPTPTISETDSIQQDLKLLLDVLKIYTVSMLCKYTCSCMTYAILAQQKLQVNRIITTRNETKKSEQEVIVKQFDQLLRYSSEIDSVVEEQEENAPLPLLATKTIIDLTLNQSYHWVRYTYTIQSHYDYFPFQQLKTTLGADVSQSSLRQTALNLDVGSLSGELSSKLRNPRNPSIEQHCEHIANTVMNMTDSATKCHILKSVSPYCAYIVSCLS